MKATLLLATGQVRELTEQETFTLRVLSHRFMGLPVLCADMHQVQHVLETPAANVLAQHACFAAYGLPSTSGHPENAAATSLLEALTDLPLESPVRGPMLLIEDRPTRLARQVIPGYSYSFAF